MSAFKTFIKLVFDKRYGSKDTTVCLFDNDTKETIWRGNPSGQIMDIEVPSGIDVGVNVLNWVVSTPVHFVIPKEKREDLMFYRVFFKGRAR